MILDASRLHFAYNGADLLRDIDFQVRPGELVAILGPNGVGKTTLLKCLNAMLTPRSGVVTVEGADVIRLRPAEIATRIGYVAQKHETARLTVFDAVLMGRTPHLRWRPGERDLCMVEATLRHLRLETLGLRRIDQLSGGELQKVCLARALVQDPRLLLLDEPVAGMTDDETERTAELFVSLAGKHSLVVVEHDMAFVKQLGGKVTVLHEGAVLAEGDLASVQEDARVIEVYLGR